jgi:hypothetical protein
LCSCSAPQVPSDGISRPRRDACDLSIRTMFEDGRSGVRRIA